MLLDDSRGGIRSETGDSVPPLLMNGPTAIDQIDQSIYCCSSAVIKRDQSVAEIFNWQMRLLQGTPDQSDRRGKSHEVDLSDSQRHNFRLRSSSSALFS